MTKKNKKNLGKGKPPQPPNQPKNDEEKSEVSMGKYGEDFLLSLLQPKNTEKESTEPNEQSRLSSFILGKGNLVGNFDRDERKMDFGRDSKKQALTPI